MTCGDKFSYDDMSTILTEFCASGFCTRSDMITRSKQPAAVEMGFKPGGRACKRCGNRSSVTIRKTFARKVILNQCGTTAALSPQSEKSKTMTCNFLQDKRERSGSRSSLGELRGESPGRYEINFNSNCSHFCFSRITIYLSPAFKKNWSQNHCLNLLKRQSCPL